MDSQFVIEAQIVKGMSTAWKESSLSLDEFEEIWGCCGADIRSRFIEGTLIPMTKRFPEAVRSFIDHFLDDSALEKEVAQIGEAVEKLKRAIAGAIADREPRKQKDNSKSDKRK